LPRRWKHDGVLQRFKESPAFFAYNDRTKNQAVKALVLATGYLKSGNNTFFVTVCADVTIDDKERTVIRLVVDQNGFHPSFRLKAFGYQINKSQKQAPAF